MGHYYRIHGLVLNSDVELPMPELSPLVEDITFFSRPSAPLQQLPSGQGGQEQHSWLKEHWRDGVLTVHFPGGMAFEVSRHSVQMLENESGDEDLVAHLLLDHVIPRLVALRGDLMLHAAGAVGRSGKAQLFLGPSGTGKSTLVTTLARSGWSLLDDDGIRIVYNGTASAVPGYAAVRLWPDSAEVALPGVPGRRVSRNTTKMWFELAETNISFAKSSAPITAIYLMARSDGPEAAVDPLSLADSIAAIASHGFHLAPKPHSVIRQAFEHASLLAASVPMMRLSCPEVFAHMKSTVALVERADQVAAGQ